MNALMKFVLVALLISTTSAHAKGLFSRIFEPVVEEAITKSESQAIDDKFLTEMAAETNKGLPKNIDKETRLDSITTGPGLRYTNNYTMVYPSASYIDKEYFFQLTRSQLKTAFCQKPDMQFFLKNGVTVCFSYHASDGSLIANIDIAPKDCGYAS